MFYQPLKIGTVNHCEYLPRLMLYFAAPAIKRCLAIKVFALKMFHYSRTTHGLPRHSSGDLKYLVQ